MKKLLRIAGWACLILLVVLLGAWGGYVWTKISLTRNQDDCARTAYQSIPTRNPDDPQLRQIFRACMQARNWSENLMFGDWPLGRHAWKD